jgi:hypothetical protein
MQHMSLDNCQRSPLAHAARTYSKHTSRDSYLLLCDVTADTENTASCIVARWDRVHRVVCLTTC